MKVTYHVEGKNAAELATGLRVHLAILDGAGVAHTGNNSAKSGRAAKPPKEEEATFELDGQETPVETEEEEAEAEVEETPTLEQIIKACQAYAKKYGQEKTIAKMKKVSGIGNVKNIPDGQRAAVIAALKV